MDTDYGHGGIGRQAHSTNVEYEGGILNSEDSRWRVKGKLRLTQEEISVSQPSVCLNELVCTSYQVTMTNKSFQSCSALEATNDGRVT